MHNLPTGKQLKIIMNDKILSATDLARVIAQQLELPQSDVESVLKELQNVIVSQMKEGSEVRLLGFGTFKTVQREAREARNPRTGEKLEIPARPIVRFVPGKRLKDVGEASQ